MEHEFTAEIRTILQKHFGDAADDVFANSPLLQYLNIKTRSANRGSKARSSFANLYAVYVLVEDYIGRGFDKNTEYSDYGGATFSVLLRRQRELAFGSKLQNHALNHRLNEEFHRYFPDVEYIPILRDTSTNRYWINENLLRITVGGSQRSISHAIIDIIDRYVEVKRQTLEAFSKACEELRSLASKDLATAETFILDLLAPNVDARIFEIVSYAILKYHYHDQIVYFGFDLEDMHKENLKLFKTGRTNANDGGIDFVMKPLGRFFQVTETLDVRKYFLDIDKIERFPISFVIKSNETSEQLRQRLREGAQRLYSISAIVNKYMSCVEEIVNIPTLRERFAEAAKQGHLENILDELVKQSRVEFSLDEPDEPVSIPI